MKKWKVEVEVLFSHRFDYDVFHIGKEKMYKFRLDKNCDKCGQKRLCTYIEIDDDFDRPKKHYCSDCGNERKRFLELQKEGITQMKHKFAKAREKKKEEERRINYLKEEIEKIEIEEKAKRYGITYPGD